MFEGTSNWLKSFRMQEILCLLPRKCYIKVGIFFPCNALSNWNFSAGPPLIRRTWLGKWPYGDSQSYTTGLTSLSPSWFSKLVDTIAPFRESSHSGVHVLGAHAFREAVPPPCGCSVAKSCPTLCDPVDCTQQAARPSPFPGVCSHSCPLRWWCYVTISSWLCLKGCRREMPWKYWTHL